MAEHTEQHKPGSPYRVHVEPDAKARKAQDDAMTRMLLEQRKLKGLGMPFSKEERKIAG